VTKWVLFLAAVIVSLPIPVLSSEVGFQAGRTISSGNDGLVNVAERSVSGNLPSGAVPLAANARPSAVLFNGTFADTQGRTSSVSTTSGQDHREAWHHTLSDLGSGQRVFGSVVKDSFGASSGPSFSFIVSVDDGAISISVPEPQTMGTLATGLGMIACLMGRNRRKS
jgi:hypothetical protein